VQPCVAVALAGIGVGVGGVAGHIARADAAPRALQVDIAPGVPVQPGELATALQVRLAPGRALAVRVTPVRDGAVAVAVGDTATDRGREVAIGTLAGADAARLIALAVADLALDDLAMAPPPTDAVAAVDARATPSLVAAPHGQLSVALVGTASAWSAPLVGGGLDAVYARGAPGRLGWLGFLEADGGGLASGALHLDAVTARAGVGVRWAAVDVRAGITAMPVWVSNGGGDQTVLWGGNLAARLRLPLTAAVRGVLAVGADAFATRSVYTIAATAVVSTPWLAPYVAVGVEVTP